MATRAELLAGADYEGYESFCHTLVNYLKNNWYMSDPRTNLTSAQNGMIVIDSDDGKVYYRHSGTWHVIDTELLPKARGVNLIINSAFGVWSRSDTNKGLATLPFDSGSVEPQVGETLTGDTSGATGKVISVTVTSGTWGGGNAAGTIELGAVSGTFQDNETVSGSVGGANILTVNGDSSIGVTNDPCNDDSTAEWTDDGANITLAFAAAEYTVTTNAANQRAWRTGCSFTAGKIYKIELDIKDGTQAGVDIELYFDDGTAQYSKVFTTGAAWASIAYNFECATTTAAGLAGFRVVDNLGGSNIEIRRFSVYEITPCCTGANTYAHDWWYKDSTLDIYREHNGSNTKDGSFYALKFVPSAAADWCRFPNGFQANEEWTEQFAGRIVTFGCWVKTSTANHARLRIWEGGANTDSAYHSGSGNWEWLEVTRTFGSSPSSAIFGLRVEAAPNTDGSTIVYFSQPILVFAAVIGEGNYQPRDNEVIWLEEAIQSNFLENYTGQSSQGPTEVNLEADTDAMLPKGARSIVVTSQANDSGSLNNDTMVKLSKSAAAEFVYYNDMSGKNNDRPNRITGWQPLDEDGDYCFEIVASGAGTFDLVEFRYHAVQVTS